MTMIETMGDLQEFLGSEGLSMTATRRVTQWEVIFSDPNIDNYKAIRGVGYGDSIARAIIECLAHHAELKKAAGR